MRILLTSGPTRQYIDPVRYISNASSGRMGCCLAEAFLELGHEVVIVSGPVSIDYPSAAKVVPVVSTEDMLAAAAEEFLNCHGMVGVAAPCDYRPVVIAENKIKKSGERIQIELIETPDVVASLGEKKREDQWTVGFALETEDAHFRAITKLHRKNCDLVVLNGVSAIDSAETSIEVFDPTGEVVLAAAGSKAKIAGLIAKKIQTHLIGERKEKQ